MRFAGWGALAALMLSSCATSSRPLATAPVAPLSSLASAIEQATTSAPPLDHAVWGILVEDDSGKVLYERNAHVLMIPASNRKLFSAATDVNCIGLGTTLSTELWRDGDDVIVRGDGDPSFASDRHASPGLEPFVEALRARGVTSVRDVIADPSRFDRVTIPPSWKVGNLLTSYSAPVDALAYDENFENGQSLADPALATALHFRDALRDAGIEVRGSVHVDRTGRQWGERIAAVQSPTLYQLLSTVLKNSHNLYAEMLYKRSSPAGSYDASEDLERRFATEEAGVDPAEFNFADGSGLSPEDLVAPSAIVKLLRWMNAPGRRNDWWTLLAQPGGEGTLRNRLLPLADRMRGKTGSIAGVNALSGIVAGTHGGYRYFSIVLNHHLANGREALGAIDAIASEIAKF